MLKDEAPPGTIVLSVAGPLGPESGTDPCEAARRVLKCTDARLLICDAAGVTNIDLGTIDVIARMMLAAGELDRRFALRAAPPALVDLLTLTGLDDVVPRYQRGGGCGQSVVEAQRKSEQREQVLGAEEEVQPGDLPA